jgi:hypothetical protein
MGIVAISPRPDLVDLPTGVSGSPCAHGSIGSRSGTGSPLFRIGAVAAASSGTSNVPSITAIAITITNHLLSALIP